MLTQQPFASPAPAGLATGGDFLVEPLCETDRPLVCWLTFPAFRPLLSAVHAAGGGVIALVAKADGLPIGLLLAQSSSQVPPSSAPGTQSVVHLLSLMTSAGWRQRGVATRLLGRLTQEAQAQGFTRLIATYTTKIPGLRAWETLLASAGWQVPQPGMRLTVSRIEILAAAPWVRTARTDLAGCEVFSWSDLGVAERQQLEQAVTAGVIPSGLSPFADEECLQPDISVGLRYAGQVVAWMTVIRSPLVANALCCRSLFVLPHLRQGHGFGPLLIVEALRRHADSAIKSERPLAIFGVPFATKKQINFFRKRLAAYCVEAYESRTTTRLLDAT